MEQFYVQLKVLDESSQRELNAYRNLGTLKELRYLKYKELCRRERRNRFNRIIENVLAGAIFASCIISVLFLSVILS